MKGRKALTCCLVASLWSLGICNIASGNPEPGAHQRIAGLKFVALLEAGNSSGASGAILLPAGQSADAIAAERARLASSIEEAMKHFGAPEAPQIVASLPPAYEVSIGGGPQPFWWRSVGERDSELLVAVRFSRVGSGWIRILLVADRVGTEHRVAAFALSLPRDRANSCETIQSTISGLLDRAGAPADHPARASDCAALATGGGAR